MSGKTDVGVWDCGGCRENPTAGISAEWQVGSF